MRAGGRSLLQAFSACQRDSNEAAVQGSVVGPVLIDFANSVKDWTGTCGDLKQHLQTFANHQIQTNESWPKSARKLSNCLKRLAPSLRSLGTGVEFLSRSNRGRQIRLFARSVDG